MTVTRRGRPAAVLVPIDEYIQGLEENRGDPSDEDTLTAIRRGLDDLAAGDVVLLLPGSSFQVVDVAQQDGDWEGRSYPGVAKVQLGPGAAASRRSRVAKGASSCSASAT